MVHFVNEILLGFDPAFFLHHCNVDRLYAFWEYVYPEYWIGNGWKSQTGEIVPFSMWILHPVALDHHTLSLGTTDGSFSQDANAPLDHATSLIPFRTKVSDYWTSDDTRGLLNTDPTKKCKRFSHILDTAMNVRLNRLLLPCHQKP